MKIILMSGGQDVPQVSAFFLPLLELLTGIASSLCIFSIFSSQHYKVIVMVVHPAFRLHIFDAVKMLPLLILSPLLDDPPKIRIFLLLSFLLVLGDPAAFTGGVVGVVGCGCPLFSKR